MVKRKLIGFIQNFVRKKCNSKNLSEILTIILKRYSDFSSALFYLHLFMNSPNHNVSKLKTSKSKFSTEDDNKLRKLVSQYGTKSWSLIASKFKNRNSRQCRDRWNNYLSPKNNHSKWSNNEDIQLMNLFLMIGKQWSKLALFFPKRTPVNVRNRCRQLLKHINQNIEETVAEPQTEYQAQVTDSSESINISQDNQIKNCIYYPAQSNQISELIINENNLKIASKDSFPTYLNPEQQKILLPPCKDLPFNPRLCV